MSWNAQPLAVTAPPSEPTVRIRMWAVISAVLFVPALIVMKILVLTTETGSECLVRGGCAPFPGTAFLVLTGAALVAMVAALTTPPRVRSGALGVQLLLETVAVGLVVAYP
ncbi:hypothetical protein ACWDYJ_19200 [Streptomyces sp. NPDC003042]